MTDRRETLIDLMLSARTAEDVQAALDAADAFLDEHPQDVGIAAGMEQLVMIQEGQRLGA